MHIFHTTSGFNPDQYDVIKCQIAKFCGSDLIICIKKL